MEDTSYSRIGFSLFLPLWLPNASLGLNIHQRSNVNGNVVQFVFLPDFTVNKCPFIVKVLNQLS